MKNIFLFLFIILFTQCNTAQEEVQLKALEKEIPALMQKLHTAGISVAVFNKDSMLYSKGFGYRDYENKKPADGNTIFGIGSCTKSFTASLLGQLEAKGKLSLNDKPSDYFETLKFSQQAQNKNIKLRDLLKHTTGLSVTSSESTAIMFATPNVDEYIQRIAHIPVIDSVGTSFHYNNMMYHLASRITEKVSNRSWEEQLNSEIFNPLGMKNSFPGGAQAMDSKNFSYGYAVDSITPARVQIEVIPARKEAGSIHSSTNDMAKWVQLWMNNGMQNGKQILPESYVEQALTDVQAMFNSNNDSIPTSHKKYYGYGWMKSNLNGHRKVEHSGGVSGFSSYMVFYPDDNLGIVVLSNQTSSQISSHITNLISHYLLENLEAPTLQERVPSQTQTIAPIDTPTISNPELQPSQPLKAYTGTFYHPGFGEINVILDGETLYADFPMTRFRLEHQGNDEFFDFFTEETPLVMWNFMRFSFKENQYGKFNEIHINLNNPSVVFEKVN